MKKILIAGVMGCFGLLWCLGCETDAYYEEDADFLDSELGDSDEEPSERATSVGLYQAEKFTAQSGCKIATNQAGYTGTGFVDYGGKGTWIELNNVTAAQAGSYTLKFRYATASNSRPGAIVINGTNVGNVAFSSTGSWTKWGTASLTKSLKAGKNTIRILANTSSGGPNLDSLEVLSELSGTRLCTEAAENKTAALSCPAGATIISIDFASYGLPLGACPGGGFATSTCHAQSSLDKVKAACLNKQSCSVAANNGVFGDPCSGKPKKLAVVYTCSGGTVVDNCPNDPNKTQPGLCGCGVPENSCQGKIYQIVPSGTSDDTNTIQAALNKLIKGDTLRLKGNFVYRKTIYLPSNFTWILDGTITLAKNVSGQLDLVGIQEGNFNNKRATAIATKPGSTGIDMSGGKYLGNGDFNKEKRVRLLNFVWAENSKFHDMTIEDASDDCFTLGHASKNNEARNLIARYAGGKVSRNGGNGLSDYGNGNKWYDSIAEDCGSDGWTPKCKNSEFWRCIARRNDGPGFGCYARLDGSPASNSQGTEVDGNKFYAIEAYDNKREGISFNIADNSGPGATMRNNFVQGIFYNNGQYGVMFRNRTADGIVTNNKVDILAFDNDALREDGSSSNRGAGINTEGNVKGLTGVVVAYGNANKDIDIDGASNCSLTVYNPKDKSPAVVNKGNSTNTITTIGFTCSQPLNIWSVNEYCK